MKNEIQMDGEQSWINELKKIQFPKGWSNEVIEQIVIHLQQYRVENRKLVIPIKGLFIVSRFTDEPIFLFKLLCMVVNSLYRHSEVFNYYERVELKDKIQPLLVTTNELRRELFQDKKPDDLINKYLSKQILFIDSIGIEKTIKLDNYNEFDIIPELVEKLYLSQRLSKINSPVYFITNCTPLVLKNRYPKETLLQLSRITKGVIISSPKA